MKARATDGSVKDFLASITDEARRDVDDTVLQELVTESVQHMRRSYEC